VGVPWAFVLEPYIFVRKTFTKKFKKLYQKGFTKSEFCDIIYIERKIKGEKIMFYYVVESSHWPMNLEFKSKIEMREGQFFRITSHDGYRPYPTRFKVVSVSDTPSYSGNIVEILSADLNVEPF
jgi:hypothetical protein